ncbi:MAG: glycerophosphodiester phosphodiesterase [Alcaligenaceae bacterium]|nr:glycerophosphodiester phosphodiesterase [Alcaligenaceae bacterium]
MTSTQTHWPYARLIAHRGAGRYAPENTLSAIRMGAQHGFTMMEYDVKLSRDGVPVLLHDDTLDRTSNARGIAGNLSFSELAEIDFGSWHSRDFAGEPIGTLASIAAYTLANGIASNIEIKPTKGLEHETGRAVAEQAARLWRDAPLPPLLSSFSEIALQAAMEAAPDLPRALLLARELPADWQEKAERLRVKGLNMNTRYITHDNAVAILDAGYTLAVYTVNDPERARELINWGCNALFTDEIKTISPTYF